MQRRVAWSPWLPFGESPLQGGPWDDPTPVKLVPVILCTRAKCHRRKQVSWQAPSHVQRLQQQQQQRQRC